MHGDDSPLDTFQAEIADDIASLWRALDEYRKANKARHEHLKRRTEKLEAESLELQNWRRIWSEMREAEGQH